MNKLLKFINDLCGKKYNPYPNQKKVMIEEFPLNKKKKSKKKG